MPDRLTEGLARELRRLNRRFKADTIVEWENADPEHRARTMGQAANFINEARREAAEEERERIRAALKAIEPQHEHLLSRASALAALDTPAPSEPEEGK